MSPDVDYELTLDVNGEVIRLSVEPQLTLLQVLRDRLGLTGTKEGCGSGSCGACTVLVDGEPMCSCLRLAAETDGQTVMTVEGLAAADELHPLQEAFVAHGGLQCGFCTPGILVSAWALLDRNPDPSDLEIRAAISGNLCRCTGYDRIVRSIRAAREVTVG